MKLRFIAVIVLLACFGHALVRAQDMDAELSKLTESLAAQIKDKGNKKITVLDFTDLDGRASELGKFVAEQLTVNFVTAKRDFAVLDRANLKRIMEEHKLTASGLVDPENAKKLGVFAGVDAMLFGTIVPIGSNVIVTVKIITTDNAEVVGGGKAKFQQDSNIQQLGSVKPGDASPTSTTNAAPATNKPPSLSADMKPFGELQVRMTSVKLLPGGPGFGLVRLTLNITNVSATTTYGVAVHPDKYSKFDLTNERGDSFKIIEISGIETGFDTGYSFQGNLTEIPPQSEIKITLKGQAIWQNARPGDFRPYHFQTEVTFGPGNKGRYSQLRKYNLDTDIE